MFIQLAMVWWNVRSSRKKLLVGRVRRIMNGSALQNMLSRDFSSASSCGSIHGCRVSGELQNTTRSEGTTVCLATLYYKLDLTSQLKAMNWDLCMSIIARTNRQHTKPEDPLRRTKFLQVSPHDGGVPSRSVPLDNISPSYEKIEKVFWASIWTVNSLTTLSCHAAAWLGVSATASYTLMRLFTQSLTSRKAFQEASKIHRLLKINTNQHCRCERLAPNPLLGLIGRLLLSWCERVQAPFLTVGHC